MDDEMKRFRAAAEACGSAVFGHQPETPAMAMRRLAQGTESLGIDAWDVYGEGGAVERLESEVAELLGKPAAVFFPSGVMAQQAALRVWCDRTGSRRVALPDLSHLLRHEDDGPRRLHGFEMEHLTVGRHTATAADLRRLSPGLGAALIELPLREAGCLLPSWEDLVELSEAAREIGCPLHADAARIWESQPFYDRPLSEVAHLFDSLYVSFYKGLGGLAGAALVGPEEVTGQARRWRTRMGGTLHHLTPYAVAALVGLRDRLPMIADCVAWARQVAVELEERGLRCSPHEPHTNTFQVHAAADSSDLNQRVLTFMQERRVRLCGRWVPADVPGYSRVELVVHEAGLAHDPSQAADWLAEIIRG